MLKTTPFHSRTAPLVRGQAWRRWAGYVVASSYDLVHDLEYAAIRGTAALIDVTPLFKYRLRGRDAAAHILERWADQNSGPPMSPPRPKRLRQAPPPPEPDEGESQPPLV